MEKRNVTEIRPCKEAEKESFPIPGFNDKWQGKKEREKGKGKKSSYPANSSLHSFLNSFSLFSLSHCRARICPTKQNIFAELICYKVVRFLSDFLVWSRRSWQKTHFWHHCLTQISKDARTRKRAEEKEEEEKWRRLLIEPGTLIDFEPSLVFSSI